MTDTDDSTDAADTELGATGRPGKAGWGPYGRRPARVLAAVAFVDAVDRGILPGVLTQVQDDIGFSDTQAGLLGTAFVLTGFLVVLPAGYLADRARRTRVIAVVLALWGVISALNALVRTFWQFLLVRAALGIGETVDNPSSQSLIADYYPPDVRGRAFALQRATPFFGQAIGLGVAGGVAALLSWRWSFLVVGVPGSILALVVWRMPEPRRGESDVAAEQPEPSLPVQAPVPPERNAGVGALLRDVRVAVRVKTLRSLMVGSAIAAGALSGLGFWAAAFYERHTSLGTGGRGRARRRAHPRRRDHGHLPGRPRGRPDPRPLRGCPDAPRRRVPGRGRAAPPPHLPRRADLVPHPRAGGGGGLHRGGPRRHPGDDHRGRAGHHPWHRLLGDGVPERHRRGASRRC